MTIMNDGPGRTWKWAIFRYNASICLGVLRTTTKTSEVIPSPQTEIQIWHFLNTSRRANHYTMMFVCTCFAIFFLSYLPVSSEILQHAATDTVAWLC
jgi:hypothetical protein